MASPNSSPLSAGGNASSFLKIVHHANRTDFPDTPSPCAVLARKKLFFAVRGWNGYRGGYLVTVPLSTLRINSPLAVGAPFTPTAVFWALVFLGCWCYFFGRFDASSVFFEPLHFARYVVVLLP